MPTSQRPAPYQPGRPAELAKALTVLLNPQWLQLYWLLGVLDYIDARWEAFVYTLLAMGILPTLGYLAYSRGLKLPNTYDLPHRYRLVPFGFNFLGLALMLPMFFAWPEWVDTTFTGSVAHFQVAAGYCAASSLVAALITLRYKLSLHMVGYCALAVPMAYVDLLPHPQVEVGLLVGELLKFGALGILVGWSRLFLRAHTSAEVLWGTVVGILVALGYWAVVWSV